MKKEDVEKAANGFYEDNTFAYKGFIHGSEWRINSVWHEVKDGLPEDGKMVLFETSFGVFIGRSWKFSCDEVRELTIMRWAYVEDLMPGKEVGI